ARSHEQTEEVEQGRLAPPGCPSDHGDRARQELVGQSAKELVGPRRVAELQGFDRDHEDVVGNRISAPTSTPSTMAIPSEAARTETATSLPSASRTKVDPSGRESTAATGMPGPVIPGITTIYNRKRVRSPSGTASTQSSPHTGPPAEPSKVKINSPVSGESAAETIRPGHSVSPHRTLTSASRGTRLACPDARVTVKSTSPSTRRKIISPPISSGPTVTVGSTTTRTGRVSTNTTSPRRTTPSTGIPRESCHSRTALRTPASKTPSASAA